MRKKILSLFILFLTPISLFGASSASYFGVEREIFTFQKGFISEIKNFLQIYSYDVSQSGDMKLSLDVNIPYFGSGKMNLFVDRYYLVQEQKTGNVDFDYKGRITFDLQSKYQPYISSSSFSSSAEKIRKSSGSLNFHIVLKQYTGDIYMKIVSLDGGFSGDEEIKKSLEDGLNKVKGFIGENYKLPSGDLALAKNLSAGHIQDSFNRTLSILESYPLLHVKFRNTDGSYTLRWNRKVLNMLKWNIRNTHKDIIVYSNTQNGQTLQISPTRNAKNNYITLSKRDNLYSLSLKASKKNRKNSMNMEGNFSRDTFMFRSSDSNGTLSMNWKDKKLFLELKTTGYAPEHIIISGDLSSNLKNMNLSISRNSEKIGTIRSQERGNFVDYSMNLSISHIFFDMIVDLIGSYSENLGQYRVLPPDSYKLLQ